MREEPKNTPHPVGRSQSVRHRPSVSSVRVKPRRKGDPATFSLVTRMPFQNKQ